jgi:hypothetical protein
MPDEVFSFRHLFLRALTADGHFTPIRRRDGAATPAPPSRFHIDIFFDIDDITLFIFFQPFHAAITAIDDIS